MVDKIDDLTMMYLFNTLYFEADWQVNYEEIGSDMYDFQTANGNVKAQFLRSGETYIHDEKSDGMLKYFKDTKYAFVAVLPKKGISLEEYIKNMTGEEFLKLMDSGKTERAVCSLPKFKYDYSVDLSEPLQAMGLTDGFDDGLADFSRMGTAALGNLYIGDVLHKTFIQVDETGAKAGAATKVSMRMTSAAAQTTLKEVVFNRPFVYAIIDTNTKLPIFIGTVANPLEEH